jgi:hypothetical protein
MNKKGHVPFIRIVKISERSGKDTLKIRIAAFISALAAGGLFILFLGYNPIELYGTIISGAFRSKMAFQATIRFMIPLLMSSLGVAMAFKMRFWNIGAEGQIIVGAVCASYFALFHDTWPHFLLLLVMFAAGALGGGLWGLIPAYFKSKYDTNETLFTLMLNYIALHIITYLRDGPIIGGILTVVGFSAFGNHPGNSIPIMVGVFFGGVLKVWDIQTTPTIIAGLFGTTLAPIAGRYGAYAGVLAGFLHLSMVMNIGVVHGGTNLYNNGFSGGLIASILVPVFECFRKEE